MSQKPYQAVMFDLLTALLNSWSLWNKVARSDGVGFNWRTRDIIGNKKRYERWRTDGLRCLPPAGGGWEGGTSRTVYPSSARPPGLPPSCLPPLGGGPRRWPRGWGGFCASKSTIPDNV